MRGGCQKRLPEGGIGYPAACCDRRNDPRKKETEMNTPEKEPLLLTPLETAKQLSISPRKLFSLTAAGEIACVRLGRAVRYDLVDLRRLIDEKKEGGTK